MNRKMNLVIITFFMCVCIVSAQKNVRISKLGAKSPNEVAIAINSQNPQNLVAGANIAYYYFSNDGGITWAEKQLASTFGVWGDPAVTFDNFGNAFFAHLSGLGGNPNWLDRMIIQKSTDGGNSWNDSVFTGFLSPKQQDKESIVCDFTTSPYHNNLYASWTEFDKYGSRKTSDSSRILFARSTDAGKTWSPAIVISDECGDCMDSSNTDEGATVAVAPNGDVYVCWTGPHGILFDKSTDGGVTFGKDIFVADQVRGWDFDIPGISRCNGLPSIVCDISTKSTRGTTYIVWSDRRNGVNDNDVFVSISNDVGRSWSAPKRVNDDTTKREQFLPAVALDRLTGVLYVVFYDRRNTTGNTTDIYLARSSDGGKTFENSKISDTTFTPNSNVFFGDYIGIAALNGKVHPIWMRMDGSTMSIWSVPIQDTRATLSVWESGTKNSDLSEVFPNPMNESATIHFHLSSTEFVELTIYDEQGREIELLSNGMMDAGEQNLTFKANGKANGVFFYRLSIGNAFETKKFTIKR